MKYIIFLIAILCPLQAQGEAIDLDRIIAIESGGRTHVDSFRGAKFGRGLCQVSEICLREYNDFNGTNYSPQDLYKPDINKAIASWYLEVRIPQLLRHYGKAVSLENILWAYNGGIGRVVKGQMARETENYIAKYKRGVK